MGILDSVRNRSGHGGIIGGLARIVLRFLQFVLAITVAGLYGVDLANAHKAGAYTDGKWVFAEVVAGLAAATTLIYAACFFIPSEKFFAWDWVLFILWTALFGTYSPFSSSLFCTSPANIFSHRFVRKHLHRRQTHTRTTRPATHEECCLGGLGQHAAMARLGHLLHHHLLAEQEHSDTAYGSW